MCMFKKTKRVPLKSLKPVKKDDNKLKLKVKLKIHLTLMFNSANKGILVSCN